MSGLGPNVLPVQSKLREAAEITPEEPRPLFRDPGEAEPFPVEALEPLAAGAAAIHAYTQAPMAIAGQAVLAAAALATQAHADVLHPCTGSACPLSCYFLTVAESGERKSAVDALALKPIRTHEARLAEDAETQSRGYDVELALHQAERGNIEKALREDPKSVEDQADLRALEAPEPPLTPMLTCPDPTIEGYIKLTASGWPALGIFSSEAGSFVGGYGMNKDNRLKTASGLSEIWDGLPIRRVRGGDDLLILYGRRLSLHLMAQPNVANEILGDETLAQQGLLSRMLVQAPASTMGRRLHQEPDEVARRDLAAYHDRLLAILEAPLPLKEGTRNVLQPRRLPLSEGARRAGLAFADEIEKGLAPDGAYRPIAGFANKIVEHAARIAGVLTLVEALNAAEVPERLMGAAIRLCRHYLGEMLRLRDAAALPPELVEAQRLLEWIQRKWPHPAIYPAPIYRNGPLRSLRTKAAAVAALAILEHHGWLTRIQSGLEIDGRRRAEAWKIFGR